MGSDTEINGLWLYKPEKEWYTLSMKPIENKNEEDFP